MQNVVLNLSFIVSSIGFMFTNTLVKIFVVGKVVLGCSRNGVKMHIEGFNMTSFNITIIDGSFIIVHDTFHY